MTDDALIGKKVGQYEIVDLLGHGGMADVYRAHQATMKRDVAMKVLSNSLTKQPNFVTRFTKEVELVTSLEHAHIVPVYEYGTTDDGLTFLTMRLIKGGTLAEMIAQSPLIPVERVASILQQVCGALDYAHQRGVIHRDIKPNNVLLDEQGNAYLADFGLAQMVDTDHRNNLTRTGTLVGTPTYISPEQALESKSDKRSDIYSLGVVLFEMTTGRPPFTGDSMFAIMQAHVSVAPPAASKLRPDLPPAIEAVLQRALAKDPNDRYQSATELSRDFSLAIQGVLVTPRITAQIRSRSKPGVITRQNMAAPTLIRPRARVFAGGGVALVLLALLGMLVLPRLITPSPVATPLLPTVPPTVNGTIGRLPPSTQLADEASRPDTGSPSMVTLTSTELDVARDRMTGSFIGIMACNLESEYHASLIRAARTRANELGIEVKVENANNEGFRQTAIINQFIAEGAKAIFMCPLDEQLIAPAVAAAQQARIVIVNTGDTVYGKYAAAFTLTNETMGRNVGEFTAKMINAEMNGEANVIILDYPPLAPVVVRADAMEKALKEGAPKAKFLGRYLGGRAVDAETSMADALKAHPDINVIMSINDAGAFGAVNVLEAAGIKPDAVHIVSVDAESEARRLITDQQYFRASLDNDPVGTATLMIDGAVKMLAGSVVPHQVLITGRMLTRDDLMALLTPVPTP